MRVQGGVRATRVRARRCETRQHQRALHERRVFELRSRCPPLLLVLGCYQMASEGCSGSFGVYAVLLKGALKGKVHKVAERIEGRMILKRCTFVESREGSKSGEDLALDLRVLRCA